MAFPSVAVIAVIIVLARSACGWGSEDISDRERPKMGWVKSFPTSPTVSVKQGDSFVKALAKCNRSVGSNGFCTIQLLGNPSERSLSITRSRTCVTSAPNVVLVSSGSVTFVEISKPGLRYISIQGLRLRGHRASNVFGIFVSGGNIQNVHIWGCKIFGFIGIDNAHGIAIYGEGPLPHKNVMIERNEVYRMKTGSSESIVVNGYVTNWAIFDNYVHDVNNIAIDAIGGEGTLSPKSRGKRVLPNPKDTASFGFIEQNRVSRMSTKTNPAYGNRNSWAAGVYVDGAHHIRIDGNVIDKTPWAIEVGAENCVITRHVIVSGNKATRSFYGDFLAGGYRRKGFLDFRSIGCDPRRSRDRDEGHGYVQRITVQSNKFLTRTGREDNILAQFRTTYAIIKDAGITPVNVEGDGSAEGDENAIRAS